MKNKIKLYATIFTIALTAFGSLSLSAQPLLGRDISYRKYVKQNNLRSREEVIRKAVHSYAFLYVTIKDGDFQGKVMMSNDNLIGYYYKWIPDSVNYEDWASNLILNEIPIDITGTNRTYHKIDSLIDWKGPKYKLLKKCIKLCDKSIVDYNMLATLFQWNIVLDCIEEELVLYFYPLIFKSRNFE